MRYVTHVSPHCQLHVSIHSQEIYYQHFSSNYDMEWTSYLHFFYCILLYQVLLLQILIQEKKLSCIKIFL